MSLSGTVIVVTGATSGIGKSSVKFFAEQGAKVAFNGRREDKGQELLAELQGAGHTAVFVQGNVTSDSDLAALFEAAKTLGDVDIVFANAGVEGEARKAADVTVSDFTHVFDVNVKGVLLTYQHAIRAFGSRGGLFVANSSGASSLALPGFAPYTWSKAAVDAIIRSAAVENAGTNIRVYTVNPLVFESEMSSRSVSAFGATDPQQMAAKLNPSGQLGEGKDVGEVIRRLWANEIDPSFGWNLIVDAGPNVIPQHIFAEEFRKRSSGTK
eukprot:c54125_g1_i1.p1 GENE.c54125_g1_i1~~c54125_g1_i1.p1  ORF type:complete len:294 (+),score=77.39 c54125_g1_i1:78-884(+)